MNAPWPGRARLDPAGMVGARHGIALRGVLPNGIVAHPSEPYPLVFLAGKTRDDLSLLDVCSGETELEDELGCAVRIVMASELAGRSRGQAILADAKPL